MKITISSLITTLSAAASALTALQAAPELASRDTSKAAIDCDYCAGLLNFCFEVRSAVLKLANVDMADCTTERSYQGPGGLQADLP